jgi:hypothetical protein
LNKRLIDAFLLLLFVLSVALVMLGIDDPFARDAICKGIGFCPAWEHKLIIDQVDVNECQVAAARVIRLGPQSWLRTNLP